MPDRQRKDAANRQQSVPPSLSPPPPPPATQQPVRIPNPHPADRTFEYVKGISVHRLYDCLAVLLKNAHKHGEGSKPISVSACAELLATESALDVLTVAITSTATEEKYMQHKQRIVEAIQSAEAGIDMVTEGYTGIKKIKFITGASEGFNTIRYEANDATRALTLRFTLHTEHAK